MKVLVVKLHALGDLVIATPALRRLRDGLPDARIDLLTTSWCAPVLMNNPLIDRTVVIENDIFFKPRPNTVVPFLRLVHRLRREDYDSAVIFHRHRLVELFIRLAGIPRRFYFDGDNTHNSVHLDERRHSALTAWELADLAVRELGGDRAAVPFLEDLKYEWHISPDEMESADAILTSFGLTAGGFAVLLPGGGVNPNISNTERRWPVDRFVELAGRIEGELGLRIVLAGAENDREVADWMESSSNRPLINLCGMYDLRITAAIFKRSGLIVCNDSGPLHIAAGVGAPVVGIFGPTSQKQKLPPGGTSVAACRDIPCRPCYFSVFKGCIFDSIRCMEELTAEEVMSAVLTVRKNVKKSA
ncbi:MAG TPA: glycosyltransferase family 9 protein [Bacteroidetes bacterium]|nr:glycosyltransferase family 9 protein [Bacteroidota bacterium]